MSDDKKRAFDLREYHPKPFLEGQPIPDSMFGLSDPAVKQYVKEYIENLPDPSNSVDAISAAAPSIFRSSGQSSADSDIAIKRNVPYKLADDSHLIDMSEQITKRCQEAYEERDTAKKETRMYKRENDRLKQQIRELTLERNNANQELALYKKRYFEVLEKLETKN